MQRYNRKVVSCESCQFLFVFFFAGRRWRPNKSVEVYFSPSNACEENIVKMINGSRQEVDVAVYSLNNTDIVEALKEADRRGVKVRILTDRLQAAGRSSKVRDLYRAGVNIRVHSKHKIEHNKFAVFDGETAVTGSYNWTPAKTVRTVFFSMTGRRWQHFPNVLSGCGR